MDVRLLRESFDLIVPRKDAFADLFYSQLFLSYPETQQLFQQTDMKQQHQALVGAIAMVVAGVEKGENLAPALRSLVERHEKYGVKPEHYPIVGQVLLQTLSGFLGPLWSQAYQETWAEAYSAIVQMGGINTPTPH